MNARPPLATALALGATVLLFVLPGCGGGGSNSIQGSVPEGDGGATAQSAPASPRDRSPGSRREYKGGEASIEGFGSEAEGPERAAILAAFHGYLKVIARRDYPTACADLAAVVRRSLAQLSGGSGPGCVATLPAVLARRAAKIPRRQAKGKVVRVRIGDHRAFVIFKAPGAKLYQQTMLREGGQWRSATMVASVLVPEL